MQLSRIHLENYRSIKSLDIELEDLAVVFGRNNAGKSNVIEALRDYSNLVPHRGLYSGWHEERVRNKSSGDVISYSLDFSLNNIEREEMIWNMRDYNGIPTEEIEALAELDFGTKLRHTFIVIPEDSTPHAQLSVWFDGEWKPFYKLNFDEGSDREVLRLKFTDFPDFELEQFKRGDVDKPNSVIANPVSALFQRTTEQWRWVSPFRKPKNHHKISERQDLDTESTNLAQVLHTLRNNQTPVFDRIVDSYTGIMEGVTNLTTPITEGTTGMETTVKIHEAEATFELSEISSGSKQILSLLTELETAEDNASLLLIEEPETHLHPGAQRTIYETIRHVSATADTQSIITTHSDVFVNETDSSHLLKAVRTPEATEFREIESGIDEELQDLGYDKSGLLQAKAVIFVEGKSDKLIVRQFCEKFGLAPDEHGVHIIDLEGEGNIASDGQSLVKLLTAFEVPFVFVVDAHNQEPREVQDELLSEINAPRGDWNITPNEVFVWEEYGIESYLVEHREAIANSLDAEADEVNDVIENHTDPENATEVLDAVYSKVLGRPYDKTSDGVLIAKRINSDALSEEVENLVEKIQALT